MFPGPAKSTESEFRSWTPNPNPIGWADRVDSKSKSSMRAHSVMGILICTLCTTKHYLVIK
jgi:hypothetical protein